MPNHTLSCSGLSPLLDCPFVIIYSLDNMEGTRVITIVVELDSRRLGGSMMLLPFGIAGLSSNTCREMLKLVLIEHLDRPTALAIAEVIKMFCTKQEVMTESGIDARIEREIANAITCIEMSFLTVITSF